jgi:hypothetical protein
MRESEVKSGTDEIHTGLSQLAAAVALLSFGKQFSVHRLVNYQRKTGPLCSSHLHKGPAWMFFVSDIFSAKDAPVCAAKGATDLRHYSNFVRFSSNDYFFFFLAVFFDFFAFFAFLAMLPSVAPKVESMQVDDRHACVQNTPQLQNWYRAVRRW